MKARGYIFDKYNSIEYKYFKFVLNTKSSNVFKNDGGSIRPLEEFIQDCEKNIFVDYDGIAKEILLNNKIVWSDTLITRDIKFYKKRLRELNVQHGNELKIVWYNF